MLWKGKQTSWPKLIQSWFWASSNWNSVLMVFGPRSHSQWHEFLSVAWQEIWLHVICPLYDPDNVIVRAIRANLDDSSKWKGALNKPSRDVKILGWSEPIWNIVLNFGGHILNEYPKVVFQEERKMKKITVMHETRHTDVPGAKQRVKSTVHRRLNVVPTWQVKTQIPENCITFLESQLKNYELALHPQVHLTPKSRLFTVTEIYNMSFQ